MFNYLHTQLSCFSATYLLFWTLMTTSALQPLFSLSLGQLFWESTNPRLGGAMKELQIEFKRCLKPLENLLITARITICIFASPFQTANGQTPMVC